MIPLGDVPMLIDGARAVLPVYSRAAVRGLRRVAQRKAAAERPALTENRREADQVQTRLSNRRWPA